MVKKLDEMGQAESREPKTVKHWQRPFLSLASFLTTC
jgi:hypothetical protein